MTDEMLNLKIAEFAEVRPDRASTPALAQQSRSILNFWSYKRDNPFDPKNFNGKWEPTTGSPVVYALLEKLLSQGWEVTLGENNGIYAILVMRKSEMWSACGASGASMEQAVKKLFAELNGITGEEKA